jgi:hypothetical protein
LLPLTDEVIFQHLSGKITVGVYPLLADETCWLLAADFDGESWNLDAQAFVESCRGMKVPAALERSRSKRTSARKARWTISFGRNWRTSLRQPSSARNLQANWPFLVEVWRIFNEYEIAGYVASMKPKPRRELRQLLYLRWVYSARLPFDV